MTAQRGDLAEIALLGAVLSAAFLVSILLLGMVRARPRKLNDRVRRVVLQVPSAELAGTSSATTSVRRREQQMLLAGTLGWLGSHMPRLIVLRQRLERAGLKLSAIDFIAFCLLSAIGGATLIRFALAVSWPLATLCSLLMATAVPHLLLSWRTARRSRHFVLQFPDIIDLIVRGVRSGLPVADSIHAAAREGEPVIAGVFAEVAGNLQLGMTLDEALWAVSARLQLQEFKFFVISLAIQQETGGNLAEILSNLSHMMRRREQVKMKVRAMSSEAKASAMIIGSLPFVMMLLLYVINADYIMKLFIDPRGWVLLGAGGLSMGLGVAIMAKLVRFEI